MSRKVAVLGVGNVLLGDEGVGVRCVEQLERQQLLPGGVGCVDGGTSTHELLGELEDLDLLVIVDALAAGGQPGTVIRLEGAAVPAMFSNRMSPHQHGINDLLATLRLVGRAPDRVVLLGVEPQRIALGTELSAPVAAALDGLCQRVVEEVLPS